MKQASISICNQKGGIGKSTFTMLLASHLHYTLGYDVLVVDCDYPQWSVQAQRERELSLIGKHGKIDPVGTDEIDPVKTA